MGWRSRVVTSSMVSGPFSIIKSSSHPGVPYTAARTSREQRSHHPTVGRGGQTSLNPSYSFTSLAKFLPDSSSSSSEPLSFSSSTSPPTTPYAAANAIGVRLFPTVESFLTNRLAPPPNLHDPLQRLPNSLFPRLDRFLRKPDVDIPLTIPIRTILSFFLPRKTPWYPFPTLPRLLN